MLGLGFIVIDVLPIFTLIFRSLFLTMTERYHFDHYQHPSLTEDGIGKISLVLLWHYLVEPILIQIVKILRTIMSTFWKAIEWFLFTRQFRGRRYDGFNEIEGYVERPPGANFPLLSEDTCVHYNALLFVEKNLTLNHNTQQTSHECLRRIKAMKMCSYYEIESFWHLSGMSAMINETYCALPKPYSTNHEDVHIDDDASLSGSCGMSGSESDSNKQNEKRTKGKLNGRHKSKVHRRFSSIDAVVMKMKDLRTNKHQLAKTSLGHCREDPIEADDNIFHSRRRSFSNSSPNVLSNMQQVSEEDCYNGYYDNDKDGEVSGMKLQLRKTGLNDDSGSLRQHKSSIKSADHIDDGFDSFAAVLSSSKHEKRFGRKRHKYSPSSRHASSPQSGKSIGVRNFTSPCDSISTLASSIVSPTKHPSLTGDSGSYTEHKSIEEDTDSHTTSESASDNGDNPAGNLDDRLDWVNVGARIGVRLLNNDTIQRVINTSTPKTEEATVDSISIDIASKARILDTDSMDINALVQLPSTEIPNTQEKENNIIDEKNNFSTSTFSDNNGFASGASIPEYQQKPRLLSSTRMSSEGTMKSVSVSKVSEYDAAMVAASAALEGTIKALSGSFPQSKLLSSKHELDFITNESSPRDVDENDQHEINQFKPPVHPIWNSPNESKLNDFDSASSSETDDEDYIDAAEDEEWRNVESPTSSPELRAKRGIELRKGSSNISTMNVPTITNSGINRNLDQSHIDEGVWDSKQLTIKERRHNVDASRLCELGSVREIRRSSIGKTWSAKTNPMKSKFASTFGCKELNHFSTSTPNIDIKGLLKSYSSSPVHSKFDKCSVVSASPRVDYSYLLSSGSKIESPTIGVEIKLNTPKSEVSDARLHHDSFSRKLGDTLSPSTAKLHKKRDILLPGVKMVVNIFPYSAQRQKPKELRRKNNIPSPVEMATVVCCKRIHIPDPKHDTYAGTEVVNVRHRLLFSQSGENLFLRERNCLSIQLKLDKSFLRDGNFSEIFIRVPDSSTHMPPHSKFPIGSCVSTKFGVGVLVGWRVQDDCHVVRALWQKRGPGSACAYFQRDAIVSIVKGAVGFNVTTTLGTGIVRAFNQSTKDYITGRYLVHINDSGRHQGLVIDTHPSDILSCPSAKFIPVMEQIREACNFQIQKDSYYATIGYIKQQESGEAIANRWSNGFEIGISCLIKAITESPDFDRDVDNFIGLVIRFMEQLEIGGSTEVPNDCYIDEEMSEIPQIFNDDEENSKNDWSPATLDDKNVMNDIFGGLFGLNDDDDATICSAKSKQSTQKKNMESTLEENRGKLYRITNSVLIILSKALTLVRAEVKSDNARIALSACSETIVFVKAVLKVRRKNVTAATLSERDRTIRVVKETFGPIHRRVSKVVSGIVSRVHEHEKNARVKFTRFIKIIFRDDCFLIAVEQGDWDKCLAMLEDAFIKAHIMNSADCAQYKTSILVVYNALAPRANEDATARNEAKIAWFAKLLSSLSNPKRSFLHFLKRDDVLEVMERIFVRVFFGNEEATQMLNIYAFNLRNIRQLMMLKNMEIAGSLWIHIIDAANEEFAWAVSRMPEQTRVFGSPLSKLCCLGVSHFRQLRAGDKGEWFSFLLDDDAVNIIHELDAQILKAVEVFCDDVRKTMEIMPYYSSIDEDILSLFDEVEFDKLLKEAAEAIVDSNRFHEYLEEKSGRAIERFLEYLPKMKIPVERREIEGFLLTCRGKDGRDLSLSNVKIKREHMICQVMGSENLLSPMTPVDSMNSVHSKIPSESHVKNSVLDDVKQLLLSAQAHGCWSSGTGGVGKSPSSRSVANALQGLPVSSVLNSAIELWQNLEIDDDELMEVAIRDVTYQIQLQKEREEGMEVVQEEEERIFDCATNPIPGKLSSKKTSSTDLIGLRRRFNPRKDSFLNLDMKGLVCELEEFIFRLEPKQRATIFDPVFEGSGTLKISNLSIKLRLEWRKKRISRKSLEAKVPVLKLQELDVKLEKVKLKFSETGFDWLLNKVVSGFSKNISEVVQTNLADQIKNHIHETLDHLNTFVEANPELLFLVLGISIDDLEEDAL